MSARSRDESGFSTVMGLGLILVVLALGGVLATVGAITVTRHRAETTADLAALAAAKHVLEGETSACAAARRLVDEQGGSLITCRLDGLDAIVVVGIRSPGRAGSLGLVQGRARAGRR